MDRGARAKGTSQTRHAVKARKRNEIRHNYIQEKLGYSCCNECGETSNLEYDHINPGKKDYYGYLPASTYEQIDRELHNIQILCRECHLNKSHAQRKAAWQLFISLPLEEQERLYREQLEHIARNR